MASKSRRASQSSKTARKHVSRSSKATGNRRRAQKAKTRQPATGDSSGEDFSLPSSPSEHSLAETDAHPTKRGQDPAAVKSQDGTSHSQPRSRPREPAVPPSFSRSQTVARTASEQEKKTRDVDYFFDRGKGKPSICQHCKAAKEEAEARGKSFGKTYVYSTTTGVTPLRHHLGANHEEEYMRVCKEKGWPIMLPKERAKRAATLSNTNPPIETPRVAYSPESFHAALVRFIVADDQSINVIECPEFRNLLLFLKEDLQDTEIPHRRKVRDIILHTWEEYVEVLKNELQKALGDISFTADLWTDPILRPFFAITAHWIARGIHDTGLKLRTALIAFHRVDEGHAGAILASEALGLLNRVGVITRMGHWTVDNADNNGTFLTGLEKLIEVEDKKKNRIPFEGKKRRIRCFAHIVNLIVQHLLKAISPSKPVAATERDEDETENDSDLEAPVHNPSTEQTFEEATARDPVGLARKLVRVLRASNSRRVAFQEFLKRGKEKGYFNSDPCELLRDVATRWDSTYLMIKRLIYLKDAIGDFLRQAENIKLRKYSLTEKEWEILGTVGAILEFPHKLQQAMSKEATPVLAGTIPALEMLMSQWESVASQKPDYAPWIEEGLKCALKYYVRMDETDAHIIALFLHPGYRLSWFKKNWEDKWIKTAEQKVKDLMKLYRARMDDDLPSPTDPKPQPPEQPGTILSLARQFGVVDEMELNEERSSQGESVDAEFSRYNDAQLSSSGISILGFWAENEKQYPTIYRIALDYLPIQATSVPSERVFSSSAETATKKRNRLHPSLFEAIQMLKFGYKKERLNFTKDWAAQESDLIPHNDSRNGLSPDGDNHEVAIDRVLKEMILRDKLEGVGEVEMDPK